MSKYQTSIKRGHTVPWGYEQHPDDPHLLLPIDEQLDTYEQAKKYLRQGCTLRDVAQWMTARTDRYISHVGLSKKIQAEKSEKARRAAQEAWKKKRAEVEKREQELHGDQQ